MDGILVVVGFGASDDTPRSFLLGGGISCVPDSASATMMGRTLLAADYAKTTHANSPNYDFSERRGRGGRFPKSLILSDVEAEEDDSSGANGRGVSGSLCQG